MRVQAVLTPPETFLGELVTAFTASGPRHRAGPSPMGITTGGRTWTPIDFAPLLSGVVALRVAALGNLTRSEVSGLLDAWGHHQVGGALVHVVGLEIEDQSGCVVARLGGDLDALQALVDAFKRVAQRRGILLDRRDFHPYFVVGSVLAPDTAAARHAVESIDAVRSAEWRIEWISLVQESFSAQEAEWREIAQLPLDPP